MFIVTSGHQAQEGRRGRAWRNRGMISAANSATVTRCCASGHIVLHELGHLIAGHRSGEEDEELLGRLFPDIDPSMIRHILRRRTSYDSGEEREAETVATIILQWASVLDSLAPRLSSGAGTRNIQDALGDRVGWL